MNTTVIVLLVALALIVLVAIAWFALRQRQSTRLRQGFGPEYERAIEEHGDRRSAERELQARKERVERFNIQPLSQRDCDRFTEAWKATQALFVDDPTRAIDAADELIAEVMRTRGYPVGDFESRAADLSVDHPTVVTNYRAAHAIAERSRTGNASTEDLRRAMVHYRGLFEELLETSEHHTEARR
ncbi:MAG: hypothetical protein U0531_02900 [Dehalococcoidia bacterium]